MNFKKEIYEIEFTEDCRDEIREIYKYISEKLVAKEAAKRLMQKMRKSVMNLAESPRLYAKIDKKGKMKKDLLKYAEQKNFLKLIGFVLNLPDFRH